MWGKERRLTVELEDRAGPGDRAGESVCRPAPREGPPGRQPSRSVTPPRCGSTWRGDSPAPPGGYS